MRRFGIAGVACLVVAAIVLGAASSASAAFGIKVWEAGTCKKNTQGNAATECKYTSNPGEFFYNQAAGHPPVGLTGFEVNTTKGPLGIGETTDGNVKDVIVDFPEGLNFNPQATPQCPVAQFESNPASCSASVIGKSYVESTLLSGQQLPFSLYNLVPPQGKPALFAFKVQVPLLVEANIFLVAEVEWSGDYHERFTINNVPNQVPLKKNVLEGFGQTGGSFLTMGSACNDPTTTTIAVDSYQEPGKYLTYKTTPPVPIVGCQAVPYGPSVANSAGGAPTDSPAPVEVDVNVPQFGGTALNNSTTKNATLSLPRGLGLNPAAAPGLAFCTDAQFPRGTTAPISCPAKSQVGTVAIQTPFLPTNSLVGKVYLGQQLSRVPSSGQEYRIFIDAVSARYGVDVRLLGNVAADPVTGQLTTAVIRTPQGTLPQVSFSNFHLALTGNGTKNPLPLSSPPICGPNTATSVLAPWSGQKNATPSGNMTLTKAPGGGPCAKTMAERPFTPGFSAAPASTQAAAFTPYSLSISRTDGQQEIKGLDLTLPFGATAKLAGVSYCPNQSLAAAASRAGAAEAKAPSCPSSSQVGVAQVQAGTGGSPLAIAGTAYLAGPYQGAPLSLAVITPALAGPFDLGVVVIRTPLYVDSETAQIHTVTKAIPDVYGGAKLDLKSIGISLNRPQFTLNGTNCSPMATTGAIFGGGADPTNPAAFAAAPASSPVTGTGCDGLAFKPKLKLRLFGAHKRNKNPKLRAELKARPGDANIGRASVALPKALFLDQASLSKICTRVQFAARQCPKKSVYGYARAFTPLLDKPLEGPVYLRSSNNELPDLVSRLQGQIDIDLVGRIDSFKGGIRTTFDRVPDVPVSKFVLTLRGGKKGLLVASRNLCRGKVKAIVQLKGQNGKKANKRVKVRRPCGHRKRGKGKHHAKGGNGKHHAKGHKGKSKKGEQHKGGGKKKHGQKSRPAA